MRDLIIIGLITICLLASLKKPVWAALAWIFVSVSSFHQQGYATNDLPVAMAVAVCFLISIAAHGKEFNFSWSPPLVWFALLTGWMTVTYLASPSLNENYGMWIKVMKINLMMFLVAGAILTRKDIDKLIWVIVLSLAITGAKGGVFTLATGGAHLVWGPGGFIGGNNEFALALVMTIPLMYYLRAISDNRWVRLGLLIAMVLCAIAALGSHSRGALLAIAAMGLMLIIKSKNRVVLVISAVLLIAALPTLMPSEWFDRMNTIKTYDEDRSAMGRINAWTMAFNLAKNNLFGSSFENVKIEYFLLYGQNAEYIQGPHSIYFQILGQHGFIGLALFLCLGISVWRCANRVILSCDISDARGAQDVMLVQMIKVSYVGFAVGGAFLALAYFDVPYYLMIVLAQLALLTRQGREGRLATKPLQQHPTTIAS